MSSAPARGRSAVALPGVLAAVVLTVITSPGIDRLLPFNPNARGADIEAWWFYARQLFGGGAFDPYGGTLPFFHMAPYLVVLGPFAAFDFDLAHHVARLVTALILAAVVVGWARQAGGGRVPRTAWLLCLSIPVVSAVYIGQVPSSLGLLALSVAIWAQRRGAWWLVGVAAAVGMIRTANALPVLAILLLGGWGEWRRLATAALTGALTLLPLVAITTLRDPGWPGQFQAAVGAYGYGLPSMLSRLLGPAALLLLQAFSVILALYWTRGSRSRPLDLDRAAAVMAMSVLAAPPDRGLRRQLPAPRPGPPGGTAGHAGADPGGRGAALAGGLAAVAGAGPGRPGPRTGGRHGPGHHPVAAAAAARQLGAVSRRPRALS